MKLFGFVPGPGLRSLAALLALFAVSAPAVAGNCDVDINPKNQVRPEGSLVTLNGSGSKPVGEVTFQWTQLTGPAVTLSGANTAMPTFTAPQVGPAGTNITLRLTIGNCSVPGNSNKNVAETTINVTNLLQNFPPVAVVSISPSPANEGQVVSLNGTASYDPEGTALTYSWLQTGGPTVLILNPNSATASFVAPNVASTNGATFSFKLTVSDGNLSNQSGDSSVTVLWTNDTPAAVLSCPSLVNEGAQLTLDASASSDFEDGNALHFEWAQLEGTPTVPVASLAPDASSITFAAPAMGLGDEGFVPFQVTVTDSAGLFATETCLVQIRDNIAPVIQSADMVVEATSAAGASVAFTPPTHDNVDGDLVAACVPLSPQQFALGVHPIACSAHDSSSPQNVSNAEFSVSVVDTTAPVIEAHENVEADATSPTGAVVDYVSPATSDAVDGAGTATCSPASGSEFPIATTAVTCTATDSEGNEALATTFDVIVVDDIAPVITPPTDVTAEATGPLTVVAHGVATATDAVGPITYEDDAPASFAVGVTTITWKATDAYTNSSIATSKVTVTDATPPIVDAHGDETAEATGPDGAAVSFTNPGATDLVDGALATVCLPASGSTFAVGDTEVTCSATDAGGNTGTGTFTVHVVDTTPPIVDAHGEETEEATGPDGAVVNFTNPGATDLVDGALATVCVPASGSTFALGDTEVTCTATDEAGNTGSGTFSVTIVDTTPPIVDAHGEETEEATGPDGAVVNFTNPDATDLVDGALATVCLPASGSTFALGNNEVTCSATDDAGNTGFGTFNVKVVDTTPPEVAAHGEETAEATGPDGAVVNFVNPAATDLVDGALATVCAPASGSTFALGDTEVSCSVTDAAGNTGSGTFNVKVVDTTPPAVDAHGDETAEATGPSGAVVSFLAPGANDLVSGALATTCAPVSGSTFALGNTQVTCSATDAAGNTGSGTFTVHVVDTTAPIVDTHGDESAEATGPGGAAVSFVNPGATDIVSGALASVCVPASGSTFALGNTSVLCTATDGAGNQGSSSFTVHVVDTTPPVIQPHANLSAEATGPGGAVVTYVNPGASDLVNGPVATFCFPASGSTFALGATTVNCAASDAAGNLATSQFTVTVVDTTAPSISAHADVNVLALSPAGAPATYDLPSASDLVDGNVAVSCSPVSGSTFAVGTTTVNCTATDSHGNTGHSSFSVIVSYAWTGFFSPVDNLPMVNASKAGSAVPVKFSLGGNMGLGIMAPGYPRSVSMVCQGGLQDEVEETVTSGGSSLSYGSGQYIYVWKTEKSWINTCRQLQVKLIDGSTHVANFKFK